ncbi:MAG: DUF2520 domain-containing protein [Flavobacteriales bacterium]|nr:DUF2520 domain-containing protein [Flavobacteriales bacterium]
MSQTPRIAILGIGNVGWNLGFRLHEIGYAVPQLISESHSASDELARALNAEVGDHPGELSPFVDIAILCVPDDVIERTVAMIPEHVAVVHTSGSTPIIEGRERSGVLYPFQTFSKHVRPDWKGIPVFIESNDTSLEKELLVLGVALSGNASLKNSEQRRVIHMSGVFGSNFVNHILHMAERVLKAGDSDFEVLRPLLHETIRKAIELGPTESQTGPARRGDDKLIQQHLELLKSDEALSDIYALLSKSISKTYRP